MSRGKKILIALCVLWLFSLLIFAAIFMGPRREQIKREEVQKEAPQYADVVISNPTADDIKDSQVALESDVDISLVTGTWISDRSDTNMLTIRDDMTFEDTDLMGSGTFEINGQFLTLHTQNKSYVLKYRVLDDGSEQLYYTVDKYDTSYLRASEEQITEKMNKKAEEEQKLQASMNNFKTAALENLVSTPWSNTPVSNMSVPSVMPEIPSEQLDIEEGEQIDVAVPEESESITEVPDTAAGMGAITFTEDAFTFGNETYPFSVQDVSEIEGDPSGYLVNWEVSGHQVSPLSLYLYGEDLESPYISFIFDSTLVCLYGQPSGCGR